MKKLRICFYLVLILAGCAPEGPHKPIGTPGGETTSAGPAPSNGEGAGANAGGAAESTPAAKPVTYEQVKPIFGTYCSACHPAINKPNWLVYDQAKTEAMTGKLVEYVEVTRYMPYMGSTESKTITDADRHKIAQWVRDGLLEK